MQLTIHRSSTQTYRLLQQYERLHGAVRVGSGTIFFLSCLPCLCLRDLNQCSQHYADMSFQVDKREDPYAPQQTGGCCIVM